MTRVFFSGDAFRSQKFGGVSRYVVELSQRLPPEGFDCDVSVAFSRSEMLWTLPNGRGWALPAVLQIPGSSRLAHRAGGLVEQRMIRRYPQSTIVHQTYYGTDRKWKNPTVVTVYDMIHELFPSYFHPNDPTSRRKHRTVLAADHVIAISECTKLDLIRLFQVPPDKITVIPLSHSNRVGDYSPQLGDKPDPYILYVGQRDGYKNFSGLIRCLAQLPPNFTVLAFGGGTPTQSELGFLAQLGVSGRVRFLHGSDLELRQAYRSATCLAYPSLYEGFGLPILEAMAEGCPVVASNLASMPYVGGVAARLLDWNDERTVSEEIERLAEDPAWRSRTVNLGFENCKRFSWNETAIQTLRCYQAFS
jgi:glycosyltransferase involved in cell wall biosynthesis